MPTEPEVPPHPSLWFHPWMLPYENHKGCGCGEDIEYIPASALLMVREALKRAHACATLRDDGTCDGCFVSEALDATRDAALSVGTKESQGDQV